MGNSFTSITDVALLGGHVVIRGNFGHAEVTLVPCTVESDCWQAEDGHCYARIILH